MLTAAPQCVLQPNETVVCMQPHMIGSCMQIARPCCMRSAGAIKVSNEAFHEPFKISQRLALVNFKFLFYFIKTLRYLYNRKIYCFE